MKLSEIYKHHNVVWRLSRTRVFSAEKAKYYEKWNSYLSNKWYGSSNRNPIWAWYFLAHATANSRYNAPLLPNTLETSLILANWMKKWLVPFWNIPPNMVLLRYWNLTFENYIVKSVKAKEQFFRKWRTVNNFNDIDLTLSILDNK